MPQSGLHEYGRWLIQQSWNEIYTLGSLNKKVELFQKILMVKFNSVFPIKEYKVSSDDKPWISKEIKMLDRQKCREFYKHKKSEKWNNLNEEYKQK